MDTFQPFWPFWQIQGALAYSPGQNGQDPGKWPEWSLSGSWHLRIRVQIEKRSLFDAFLEKPAFAEKTNGEILTFWPFWPKAQIESSSAVNSPVSDRKVRKTCRNLPGTGFRDARNPVLPELSKSGGPSLPTRVKGGDSFPKPRKTVFSSKVARKWFRRKVSKTGGEG